MAANIQRGEIEIQLNGKTYVMRPTFEILSTIEQRLGQGLVAIGRKMAEGNITIDELAIIISASVTVEPPAADFKDSLIGNGLGEAYERVAAMLTMVFGGVDANAAQ